MQLSLRYHPEAQLTACAAFLRGTDPAAWLRELGRWGLAAGQVSCYLVPESIRSLKPAGLFVVVTDGSLPADVLEPYGQVAERLYIPVQATLWPATTPGELQEALLWPRQLLHPSIGLVGFDTCDELDLLTLLDCGPPRPTDWSRARPGLPPKPRLQQLRVLPVPAAAVVEALQQHISSVPLSELPGNAAVEPIASQQWLDNLRHRLLKASLSWVRSWRKSSAQRADRVAGTLRTIGFGVVVLVLVGLVISLVASLGTSQSLGGLGVVLAVLLRVLNYLFGEKKPASRRPSRPAAPSDTGALARLEKRLRGRIDALEQKRHNELERLLRLFQDNPAEALKYAIPLGGPYQNRGTAPLSAQLGVRDSTLNLSRLGGGSSTDVWDLGPYEYDLRQQYQAAAQAELTAGHFQQAAYIHAHLLGDYRGAANVLEQGGLFREAAALHQDHLHNTAGAAQCLERGGLLLEAAELFATLGQHEKTGDLYSQLTQPALAKLHYEVAVDQRLANEDRPAAARLLVSKMGNTNRAQQVLLEGWASTKQPEVCLTQYFEVVATEPEPDWSTQVRTVFHQHTARERQVALLRVLATVTEKHLDPTLLVTSRDIAYEVVSAEASAGNPAHLPLLRHFLPADRLLSSDLSRYATSQSRPSPTPSSPEALQLDASIEWKNAVSHRQQWVAVGVRDERLHLARGNWYGTVEYYSWTVLFALGTFVELLADAHQSTRIFVRPAGTLALEALQLPKNRYFPEPLTVECPSWLPPWPTRIALLPEGNIATAHLQAYEVHIQQYTAAGQLGPSLTHCLSTPKHPFTGTEREWPCELLYQGGQYYTYWGNWVVQFGDAGPCTTHILEHEALQLVRSPYAAELTLAVASETGFLRWQPTQQSSNPPHQQLTDSAKAMGALCFISSAHIVSLDAHQAELYYLTTSGAQLVRTITTVDRLVAVLPTNNRQQFALLETTGRLSLYEAVSASLEKS
ncbi:MAG: hypothetical protein ACRYG7_20190 [Janthinobacterium lividum]